MKGYIYTMFQGADPDKGWQLNDPIFIPVPTLGACVPNIRRAVEQGDYVFAISGRLPAVKQYVVGGFQVDEKITALEAYSRIPENRIRVRDDRSLAGNIIVDSKGNHNPNDAHKNFEDRINNYLIGVNPIVIADKDAIEKARKSTVNILNQVFNKSETSVGKIIGRWRKLDPPQIEQLVDWMKSVGATSP